MAEEQKKNPGSRQPTKAGRSQHYTRRSARSFTPRKKRIILLENLSAYNYNAADVERFIEELRAKNFDVTRLQPGAPSDMARAASAAIKGKPHALVAVGGDGSVNLVGRALVGSPVRMGILPQGKLNNIFSSLIGKPNLNHSLASLMEHKTRLIDCGKVSGQPFFGSVGLGILPAIQKELNDRNRPRLSFGWSRLVSQAASTVKREKTPIKIDSFRFDVEPALVNVNLLSHSAGLRFAPTAISDDRKFEVTIDMSSNGNSVSKVISDINKNKYFFDEEVRLYRGEEITIGSVKDRTLYLDGELISVPTNTLEITLYDKKLKVCAPEIPYK